jgi:hypothetical protein
MIFYMIRLNTNTKNEYKRIRTNMNTNIKFRIQYCAKVAAASGHNCIPPLPPARGLSTGILCSEVATATLRGCHLGPPPLMAA